MCVCVCVCEVHRERQEREREGERVMGKHTNIGDGCRRFPDSLFIEGEEGEKKIPHIITFTNDNNTTRVVCF